MGSDHAALMRRYIGGSLSTGSRAMARTLPAHPVRMPEATSAPPGVPAILDAGRGCYPLRLGQVPHPPSEFKKYKEEGMPWDGGPYKPIHVLQHNGLGYGCRGLLFHIVPASGPVSPSLSMAIVANHSFGVDPDIHAILDILRKIEFLQIWPEGDLWNA